MKLSDVIARLEELRAKHGEADVFVTVHGELPEPDPFVVIEWDEDAGGVVIDTMDR
jgi:hypothetical protein